MGKGKYPDHIFCQVGDITSHELVQEHEEEQQEPVIILPNPGEEEQEYLYAQPQYKTEPAEKSQGFCRRIRNGYRFGVMIEIISPYQVSAG